VLTGALLLGGLLDLIALAVPVGFALGVISVLYLVAVQDSLMSRVQQAVIGTDSFVLLALPFFVLAGNLMNASGITNRLFAFASALVGHFRGGLAHANVVGSMLMAGMSGSAIADVAGLGTVEIKAMRDEGYEGEFAVGITLASSTLGPIIPPSINMVIYAVLTNVSVGRLFMGGFGPGLVMGLCMMLLVYVLARRRNYPWSPRPTASAFASIFGHALPALLTPVILLGGLFAGIFTPTEAAAVAALYALAVGVLWYRAMGVRGLYDACVNAFHVTASAMFIVAMASVFAWALAREQIPQTAAAAFLSVTQEPWLVLLVVNVVLLIAGCFLDPVSAMIILMPVLLPIQGALGFDPVHFGVMVVLNLTIGNITPPVGMCLFVGTAVSGLSMERVVRGVAPFLGILLVALAVVTYIPQTVTFLPDLLMGTQR
jgi:tripartite ATP-independent transporter DctM subunit